MRRVTKYLHFPMQVQYQEIPQGFRLLQTSSGLHKVCSLNHKIAILRDIGWTPFPFLTTWGPPNSGTVVKMNAQICYSRSHYDPDVVPLQAYHSINAYH